MKAYPRFVSPLAILLAAAPLMVRPAFAQPESVPVTQAIAPPNATVAVPLEELVAPIALYPDALIALILPAATNTSDVVLAARFLKSGGVVEQVDNQPWDDSVKGLAHYPDVIKWMDENLTWTQRIGEVYVEQPQAVMNAIQSARTIARNNGVLVDTPQQQVVMEESYIRIIPAQPDIIYVPRYDPEIIYVQRPTYYSPDPWLTFGIGFGVGSWLAYDLDWGHHRIWVDHNRHDHWRDHQDWRYRSFQNRPGYIARDPYWRPWQPSLNRPRPPHRDWDRGGHDFVRPSPLPGAPHFDRDRWQNRSGNRPDHYAGGSRPGVREAWDRNNDHQRTNRPANTVRQPSSSNNFSAGSPGPTNGITAAPVPPPAVQSSPERQRGNWDRTNRRLGGGNNSNADRPAGNGSVSVVPTERRPQPAVTGTLTPTPTPAVRNHAEGERRRGPSGSDSDRSARPAMPAVRSQTFNRPVAVAPTPSAPVAAAPSMRPAPQVREFRQPQRMPQQAAAPAQQRAVAPQVQPSNSGGADRAPRAAGGDHGRSESRGGGGRDRQQEH